MRNSRVDEYRGVSEFTDDSHSFNGQLRSMARGDRVTTQQLYDIFHLISTDVHVRTTNFELLAMTLKKLDTYNFTGEIVVADVGMRIGEVISIVNTIVTAIEKVRSGENLSHGDRMILSQYTFLMDDAAMHNILNLSASADKATKEVIKIIELGQGFFGKLKGIFSGS